MACSFPGIRSASPSGDGKSPLTRIDSARKLAHQDKGLEDASHLDVAQPRSMPASRSEFLQEPSSTTLLIMRLDLSSVSAWLHSGHRAGTPQFSDVVQPENAGSISPPRVELGQLIRSEAEQRRLRGERQRPACRRSGGGALDRRRQAGGELEKASP